MQTSTQASQVESLPCWTSLWFLTLWRHLQETRHLYHPVLTGFTDSFFFNCLCPFRIWWTGGSPWLGRLVTSERNMTPGSINQSIGQSDCLEIPFWRPAPKRPGKKREIYVFLSYMIHDEMDNLHFYFM